MIVDQSDFSLQTFADLAYAKNTNLSFYWSIRTRIAPICGFQLTSAYYGSEVGHLLHSHPKSHGFESGCLLKFPLNCEDLFPFKSLSAPFQMKNV